MLWRSRSGNWGSKTKTTLHLCAAKATKHSARQNQETWGIGNDSCTARGVSHSTDAAERRYMWRGTVRDSWHAPHVISTITHTLQCQR
jgi:hypothetical protein